MDLCLAIQSIHWETTKEIIGLVTSLIGSLAGLGAVVVAYMGLQTWKKQLIGTAQHELASKFNRSFFEYRERFNDVRYPSLLISEMPADANAVPMPKADYGKRWEALKLAKLKVEEASFDAKAGLLLESRKVDELLNDFSVLQSELHTALEEYFSGVRSTELVFVVYKPADLERDEIGKKLNILVAKAENLAKPFLK